MDKILITGSNGFLGSHLIDKCIDENYIVYGLDRPSSSFRNLVKYTKEKETFSKKIKLIF